MKLRILTIVALTAAFVLGLTAAGAAQAQAQPKAQAQKPDALLGTWDVKTEDGSREFVWDFSLKDGKLVGKHSGASGTVDMADLTFADNTVKFHVTVGNGMVIDFSAIVADDKLSGTLSLQYGEAGITGSRRK
jgi:hypothetical protein